MHKEHRVGYFGKLCAHRAGPRAVQQRGRQRQQDEHPGTGQRAGDLTVPGLCQHGPRQQQRGQNIPCASGERSKTSCRTEISGICTATSRASQPSRCTGMQAASVSAQVSHGLLRSPRCKSGNSRYKNRMLPRNHSPTQAKVCSDPARGNGKVVEPQKRQHQRDGPGPAEAAGVRHKPIAEHDEPREPEQRVDSPRAPFVKLRRVLLRRDGQRQRCAGHNGKTARSRNSPR